MLSYLQALSAYSSLTPPPPAEAFREIPSPLYREGPLVLTPKTTEVSVILTEVSKISTWIVKTKATPVNLERSVVKMIAAIPHIATQHIVEVADDICRCARTLLSYHLKSHIEITLESIFPSSYQSTQSFPLAGFHLDSSPFRLIRTYVGPGTEWLNPQAVDTDTFHTFFKSGIEQEFARTSDIQQIPTSSIVMFHGPSFIHRRPSSHQPRVFLAIDAW